MKDPLDVVSGIVTSKIKYSARRSPSKDDLIPVTKTLVKTRIPEEIQDSDDELEVLTMESVQMLSSSVHSTQQSQQQQQTQEDSQQTPEAKEPKKDTKSMSAKVRQPLKPSFSIQKPPKYRVGLSRRVRIESLHSYLNKR